MIMPTLSAFEDLKKSCMAGFLFFYLKAAKQIKVALGIFEVQDISLRYLKLEK